MVSTPAIGCSWWGGGNVSLLPADRQYWTLFQLISDTLWTHALMPLTAEDSPSTWRSDVSPAPATLSLYHCRALACLQPPRRSLPSLPTAASTVVVVVVVVDRRRGVRRVSRSAAQVPRALLQPAVAPAAPEARLDRVAPHAQQAEAEHARPARPGADRWGRRQRRRRRALRQVTQRHRRAMFRGGGHFTNGRGVGGVTIQYPRDMICIAIHGSYTYRDICSNLYWACYYTCKICGDISLRP